MLTVLCALTIGALTACDFGFGGGNGGGSGDQEPPSGIEGDAKITVAGFCGDGYSAEIVSGAELDGSQIKVKKDTVVKFNIIISGDYYVDDDGFRVQFNSRGVSAPDGVYTLTVNSEGSITVTGIHPLQEMTSSDVTVRQREAQFDGSAHTFRLSVPFGATVKFSEDNEAWLNEQPSYTDAGDYMVYFKVEMKNYKPYTGTVTFIIQPLEIKSEDVKVTNNSHVFDNEAHAFEITGAPEGSVIEYSLTNYGEYSEAFPELSEVGKYYIYYKILCKNYSVYFGAAYLTITEAD